MFLHASARIVMRMHVLSYVYVCLLIYRFKSPIVHLQVFARSPCICEFFERKCAFMHSLFLSMIPPAPAIMSFCSLARPVRLREYACYPNVNVFLCLSMRRLDFCISVYLHIFSHLRLHISLHSPFMNMRLREFSTTPIFICL